MQQITITINQYPFASRGFDANYRFCGFRLNQLTHLRVKLLRIYHFPPQIEWPREGQQLANDAGDSVGLRVDDIQIAISPLLRQIRPLLQYLNPAFDDIQWRSHLVCDACRQTSNRCKPLL